MIKFTCEICGGNLLLDENGYATCPDCGAKYSKQTIDKIKKKIRESARNETESKVNDLLKTAQSFMADGAFSNAKKVLSEAYKIAPRNYKVILETAKCEEKLYFKPIISLYRENYIFSVGENGKNFHLSVIENAIETVKKIITGNEFSEQEKISIYNELAITLFFASTVKTDYFHEKYNSYSGNTNSDKYYDLKSDLTYEEIKSIAGMERAISLIENLTDELSVTNVIEMKHYICVVIYDLTCYNTYLSGNPKLISKYDVYRWDIRKLYPDFGKGLGELADPFPYDHSLKSEDIQIRKKNIVEYWHQKDQEEYNRREKQLKALRIADYWAKHADEQKKLQDEQTTILAELSKFNSQLGDVECDMELVRLETERQALLEKFGKTNLFSFKERKALRLQIESLKQQIEKLKTISQSEHDEIDQQIARLKHRLEEIDFELERDRP